MRTLITLCFFLFVSAIAGAQTTLYSQDFESTYAEWTLTSTDLSGVSTPNYWTVTNVYTGNIVAPTVTPDEPTGPSGITGAPESYYMHIRSTVGPANATFNASGNHNCFSAMNTPIVTTGYSNVTISFWWLCNGNNVTYGKLYYRTSSSSAAWTQVSTASIPPAALDSYNVTTTWTLQTIHIDSFDNKGFLEFGFLFHHQGAAGSDPSFAVDDIKVIGTPSVTAPVASFSVTSTALCQDSCTSATSTSTGTVDSVRWTVAPSGGAAVTAPTAITTPVCFTSAGTFSVTLTAYNSGGSNSSTSVITVNPTPHPTITQTGHTLTVASAGSYTSFQWFNGLSVITGATNSSYTYTASGLYTVVVDSAGCPGISNSINGSVGVAGVTAAGEHYWLTQADNNMIMLYTTDALTDPVNVTVYNITGQKVMTTGWAKSSSLSLSTVALPPGLYLVRLSNDHTSQLLRFMRQ